MEVISTFNDAKKKSILELKEVFIFELIFEFFG
jgi:hypothetical protein